MRDSFKDTGSQILNCINRREICFVGDVVDVASTLVVVYGRHTGKETSSRSFHHHTSCSCSCSNSSSSSSGGTSFSKKQRKERNDDTKQRVPLFCQMSNSGSSNGSNDENKIEKSYWSKMC